MRVSGLEVGAVASSRRRPTSALVTANKEPATARTAAGAPLVVASTAQVAGTPPMATPLVVAEIEEKVATQVAP